MHFASHARINTVKIIKSYGKECKISRLGLQVPSSATRIVLMILSFIHKQGKTMKRETNQEIYGNHLPLPLKNFH